MPRQPTVHVQMNDNLAVSTGLASGCLAFGVCIDWWASEYHPVMLIRPFNKPDTIVEAAMLGVIHPGYSYQRAVAFTHVPQGIPFYPDETGTPYERPDSPGTERNLYYLYLGLLEGSPTYNGGTSFYTYTAPSTYEFDGSTPLL